MSASLVSVVALVLLVSGCCLSPRFASPESFELREELVVTCVDPSAFPEADDPAVIARYAAADGSGTTSIRFETADTVKTNSYPEGSPVVFADRTRYPETYVQRDRDLGQTFRTGDAPMRLDAVYLKLGPNGGDPSSLGAKVALQIFEVSGSPVLNENGTPGYAGSFDRSLSPELDDYLEGETYRSVAVAQGRLPLTIGPHALMKWDLTGESEITLAPDRCYAFMIMLIEPKAEQQFSLANHYYGRYAPDPANRFAGHAIRREGRPKFTSAEARLRQMPGTLGFPDVCTWRDFYFCVTGRHP